MQCQFLAFNDMSDSFSLVWGTPYSKGELYPVFGQVKGARELLLHLMILNYFYLKIIFMPKWHILGWHMF